MKVNILFINRIIITLLVLLQIQLELEAKTNHSYIDTVYSFTPGTGQNAGQSAEFYPMNIFGAPTTDATEYIPASAESDVLSLGTEGIIIVGVKNSYIVNGEGDDFVIFENAFKNQATKMIFAEPAKVSVSLDGVQYFDFPYDEWTLEGCAGKTPTNGSANPFTDSNAGGDGFDLEKIGLDKIKFIKITDISMIVTKDENHPYYTIPSMVTGFDLDAVACKYVTDIEPASINGSKNHLKSYPDRIAIKSDSDFEIKIYNIQGMIVEQFQSRGELIIPTSNWSNGVYLIYYSIGNWIKTEIYMKY